MARDSGRPQFSSSEFAGLLDTAGQEILIALKRADSLPEHHPSRGQVRETGLRTFLRQLLPDKYYVGSGFIFDAEDRRSKQLDIIIALNPPFARIFERDTVCYLPCEVVLAAIEVKSTLNRDEIVSAAANAASIRDLRPFGSERFAPVQQGGAPMDPGHHRVFYSLVALSSDLAISGWSRREWKRTKRVAKEVGTTPDVIDRLVALDRGQVIVPEGKGQDLPAAETRVAGQWFLNLWNHLEREAGRRKEMNINIYLPGEDWQSLR